MKPLVFWLPLGVCTYLAFMPSPEQVVGMLSDVVQHAFAFAYLTFALLWVNYAIASGLRAIGWMVAYALFIEAVQSTLPERSAEVGDLAVDAVGIALGFLGYKGYVAVRRRIAGAGG